MAKSALLPPTPDDVVKAERAFDEEEGPIEWVLTELFRKFPDNSNPVEVLTKTKVLNLLYSTQIRAVDAVARHICRLAIDQHLFFFNDYLFYEISTIKLKSQTRHNFSFASKYCHWHNPTAYPIYDSNVEECLWRYRKQPGAFDDMLKERGIKFPRSGYDYPEFVRIVNAFRDAYHLNAFTYKQLDKLLFSRGRSLREGKNAQ